MQLAGVCTLEGPRVLAESLEGDVVEIVSGGVSDVGRVRTNNEDSYQILNTLNLFVLSDGMGGEAHGEVASALAVDTIVKYCTEGKDDSGMTLAASSEDRQLVGKKTQAAEKCGARSEFENL